MENTLSWPVRAEMWLDARGKFAWIGAIVLGFVFFWPVGLALLAYMIWGKRGTRSSAITHQHSFASSGNTAFDTYKADMLRRLEDEQVAFQDFLQRLRDAKDKQEFDTFMDDRAKKADTDTPKAA